MKNSFFNKPVGNIYLKPSSNSEITSQILYGEKFKILSSNKKWFKIKNDYDNYTGFIKKINYYKNFAPSNKICKLKSKIFIKKNNRFIPTKSFLYFGSGISIKNNEKNYIEFKKNKWIKKNDTKKINHYEKNFLKVLKLFLNTKYLWGGKTAKGIDCSALIQNYFYYNRIFFPRDTKDQIKFCRKKKKKNLSSGDIIFWKGHVGLCINKSKFLHAYGPKKKVLIMPIFETINRIQRTANLSIKKIASIKNF